MHDKNLIHAFFPSLPQSQSNLAMEEPRKPRVVIIGAGISGLSAASRLSSASMDFTILEASHRTGGRILTSQFGSTGEQIEIGATWIHGIDGSPLYEIAQNTGALHGDVRFECMDGFPAPPIVKAHGGVAVDEAIVQKITSLYKQLIADVNDRRGVPGGLEQLEDGNAENLGCYLRRRLDKYLCKQAPVPELHLDPPKKESNAAKSLQEGVFAIQENWERVVTGANSLNDLDLSVFNEYWEFPGEQITIAKGFSSIPNAIAKSLPSDSIQYHKKVAKIIWSQELSTSSSSAYPVQLHCEDGSVYEADHVIITVSLGVLKAKTTPSSRELFRPRLPQWKLDPISKLGFGVVDKLFVLMEPSPDGSQHPNLQFIHKKDDSVVPRWIQKTHSMYPIHKNSNVLVAWFAGKEAQTMETLSDEEIARGVQKTLAAFGDQRRVAGLKLLNGGCCYRNGNVSCNGMYGNKVSIAHGSWNQNPLFLGSYSYVAVGSSGEDIDLLAEPVPRENDDSSRPPLQLLFAGEATHREQYSTTHGAYFSGIREAERILGF